MSDLRLAIDAFDRLYKATCGRASDRDLAVYFGESAARRIIAARQDIARLRAHQQESERWSNS